MALRLARFNTRISSNDKRYFQGLPSPAGAGMIAGLVWVCVEYEIAGFFIRSLAFLLTPLVGFLMVSNIPYRSFKDLDLKGNVSFMVILLLVFGLVLISIDPPDILFTALLVYGFSGPITRIWHLYRKRRVKVFRKNQAASKESKNAKH